MRPSATVRWLLACAGSALLLSAVVLGLMRARVVSVPPALVPAAPHCELPMPELLPADAEAEHPPLILWAVNGARLFIDGRAAFSPPEAPKTLAPGTYTLRVEAEGHAPVETRFRLDPWQPALFHAEVDAQVGIVLLGVGAVCESCEMPLTPLTVAATAAPSGLDVSRALREAAAALRVDDWQTAASVLGPLPPNARRTTLSRKLLAGTYLRAAAPGPARAELSSLRTTHSEALPSLLQRLDALRASAQARRHEVTLSRWNRLTMQHAALVRLAATRPELGIWGEAARMEDASARFGEARAAKDALAGAQAFSDAREAATGLLVKLVGEDCEARAHVIAALSEVGP